MIPNINKRGHSFKGVTAYLMHDRNAQTDDRVAWTSTHNLHTDDVMAAARWMAWTDMHREDIKSQAGKHACGRSASAGNVYHFSLSWSPDEQPSKEHMEMAAHSSIERLGLQDHQYYMVAHTDTDHAHLHIVVNLVNAQTGQINKPYKDYKVLDRWAHEYEQEYGIKCEDRDKKYEAWENDQPAFAKKERKAEYAKAVTQAYHHSDSASAFVAAMEEKGLTLARGHRRGFVVVDERGDVYSLTRLIQFDESVSGRQKTKSVNDRLSAIDKEALPFAHEVQASRQEGNHDLSQEDNQTPILEENDEQAADTMTIPETKRPEPIDEALDMVRLTQGEKAQDALAALLSKQHKDIEQQLAQHRLELADQRKEAKEKLVEEKRKLKQEIRQVKEQVKPSFVLRVAEIATFTAKGQDLAREKIVQNKRDKSQEKMDALRTKLRLDFKALKGKQDEEYVGLLQKHISEQQDLKRDLYKIKDGNALEDQREQEMKRALERIQSGERWASPHRKRDRER